MFREHTSVSGVPVVYRSPEEKATNAERLNLDRRGLTVCPILESEDQLRLLNYQHNAIRRIENVESLRRLIFLDFYDNHIERIDGLTALRSLRVLMLGKNRIKKIENLESLTKLDVLDLHGNQIHLIEGLQHLSDLRVLNLAGNLVDTVKNLSGLTSLVELNLRRNHIHVVSEVDCLPNLQRLFLSFNNITSYDDISCISDNASLTELALDGNPFAQDPTYKQTVLRYVQQLKQLDMKRITEEERRIATVMGRKEDEKKRENTKMAVVTERRRRAISTVRKQWEKSFSASRTASKLELHARHVGNIPNTDLDRTSSPDSDAERPSSAKSTGSDKEWATNAAGVANVRPSSVGPSFGSITSMVKRVVQENETGDSSSNHVNSEFLSEIDGDTLKLYGLRSLDAFDRSWGFQAAGAVTNVHFHFVDFADVSKVLTKIRIRFPNVCSLVFTATNIRTLAQFNALANVRRLDNLTVETDGNPVTELSLWRPYVVFRLAHFSLKRINGVEVSVADVVSAEKFFGPLANLVESKIPQSRLATLLGDRKKQLLADDRTKRTPADSFKTFSSPGDKPETVGRAVFVYPSQVQKSQEQITRSSLVKSVLHSLTADATLINRRRAALSSDWPSILSDLVRSAVIDMWDHHAYAKHCFASETMTLTQPGMPADRVGGGSAKEHNELATE
jgi:leucine-rich repeat-containing protein 49